MTVSELSLGLEHLQGKDARDMQAVMDRAIEVGINYCDAFMAEPNVRDAIGAALRGRRDKMQIQGHYCPTWRSGQHETSRNLSDVKEYFDDLLARLHTDYIDVGMIFYVDDSGEWDRFIESDTMEYIRAQKRSGVIRAIGLSAHNPPTAMKAVLSGEIDVLMFSINPAFDLLPDISVIDEIFDPNTFKNDRLTGLDPSRAALYRACEERGVGITVMKAIGAGILLSGERSPLGRALSVTQLMHYALTRPAVSAVMLGVVTPEQIDCALEYFEASDAEREYITALSEVKQFTAKGRCMYCNHCLPCPSEIDIAQVGKFLDIAEGASGGGQDSIREHYAKLARTAADCVQCGACEPRCPFDVKVRGRMLRAREVFGG